MQTIDNVNIKKKEMKKENAKNHKYISFKKVRYEKNEEYDATKRQRNTIERMGEKTDQT